MIMPCPCTSFTQNKNFLNILFYCLYFLNLFFQVRCEHSFQPLLGSSCSPFIFLFLNFFISVHGTVREVHSTIQKNKLKNEKCKIKQEMKK